MSYTLLKLIIRELFSYCRVNYYIAKISGTMATAFIATTQIKVFAQIIFSILTDLKEHKRADTNNIHSEILKTLDFKDTRSSGQNQCSHNQREN